MSTAAEARSNLFALPAAQPAPDVLTDKVERLETLVEQIAEVVLDGREQHTRAPVEPTRPASQTSSPGPLERAAQSLRNAIYD